MPRNNFDAKIGEPIRKLVRRLFEGVTKKSTNL